MRGAVGVSVVALGLVAGSSSSVDEGGWHGRPLPEAVATHLHWGAPGIPPEMAVSNDQLLVVGGIDQVTGEDPHLRIATDAFLVDLDTGGLTELPAPAADLPIEVLAAAGYADGFVVVGARCRGGDHYPIEDRFCEPGTGTAFRLDAGGDSWVEVPFPADVSPPRGETLWTFQPTVGALPDGRLFVVVWVGPAASHEPDLRMLVLDDTRWIEVGQLPGRPGVVPVDKCATSDAIYVLTREGNEPPPEGGPSGVAEAARMGLYAAPLAGGPVASVDLPDIDTSYGGVAVTIACDRSGVYVTSSEPDPTAPMRLLARRGSRWQEIGGDWEPGIVRRVGSAANGVAVVSMTLETPGRLVAHTVAAGARSAVRTDPATAARAILVDGSTGNFVTVGPLGFPGAEVSRDLQRAGTVTADELVP